MLRRNLSDDTQASLNSAMIWSLMAIIFITAVVPASLFATNQIQDLSADESYFSPETLDELTLDRLLRAHLVADHDNPPHTASDSAVAYAYINSSDESSWTSLEPYTKNFTDQDWHELIIQDSGEGFNEFVGLVLGVNHSLESMITNDLHTIELTAQFPRNTSLQFEISVIGQEGGEAVRYINKNGATELNVTTNMDTYTFNIPFSKLLSAHSELGDDARLLIRMSPAEDNVEEIQPADVIRYNIDFVHSTSAMGTFWTINVMSGLLGGFLMIAAVFSTPWVDLRDLTGRF